MCMCELVCVCVYVCVCGGGGGVSLNMCVRMSVFGVHSLSCSVDSWY